ncbi:hypothetical protein TRFO_12700 [Tritrichomonas foetus]|uniref:Ubiquitin-like domain-containing protein n=1 Tax=Tritrichomonas foetus TaxID=1144522 RepID=A0A1J4L4U8_9EUKA|nr:hypothetical protein TRFO_12700 [Tritrichomonas foetus]|eukprot:OHT17012.1 hypothetical protein TRFO_12700 [Tritrichomonas foetus]
MTTEEKVITINIKVLGSEVEHQLSVPLNLTIQSLKELITDFCDFPIDSIRLIFRGRSLQNAETISHYNIEDGHTIIVHGSKKANKDKNEDPPAPNQPNPPPQLQPQNPSLPPLPRNEVTDVKRDLSHIQYQIALLIQNGADLQNKIATSSNPNEINDAILKFATENKNAMAQLYPQIQSLKNKHFVANNNRVEVGAPPPPAEAANSNQSDSSNNSSTNESNSQNQNTNQNQTDAQPQNPARPVVEDIFSPFERALVQQQAATLAQYVSENHLDEAYTSP